MLKANKILRTAKGLQSLVTILCKFNSDPFYTADRAAFLVGCARQPTMDTSVAEL